MKRNEPCRCGSGLKFKKCCWVKDNVINGSTALGVKDYIKRVRYTLMSHYKSTGHVITAEQAVALMEKRNG